MGNKMNTSIKTWVHMKTQKPYYKKSTKKRVEEIEKGIAENKEKFAKRIKQLDHIVKDLNYIPKDSANGYHEFIQNMHSALVGGRKITRKMESSIVKIITTYTEWLKKENDPEYKKNKIKYIENSLTKIKLLEDKLYEANYSKSYMSDKEYFLNSIKSHVKSRGNLSSKQKQEELGNNAEAFLAKNRGATQSAITALEKLTASDTK